MKNLIAVFVLFTLFACGGTSMRRLTDVELNRSDLSVADSAQHSFQSASRLGSVAAMSSYAGLAGENGALSVVATLSPGCYMLVGTAQVPLAEIAVGATDLTGELVNHELTRNDSYQTAGMAARGFCLRRAGLVTLGAVTRNPRMAVVLALYPMRDSNALVQAVAALQNSERTGMQAVLTHIANVVDPHPVRLPWEATFPAVMGARTTAVSGLPAGAAPGMCVLVAVTGSGGSARDVDLYVFTGEPPVSPDRMLASDDRISPNAVVVFRVPDDPNVVRVGVQSYAGGGSVEYAAYRVSDTRCVMNGRPVPPVNP